MNLLHLSDIHFNKRYVGTALDPDRFLRATILKDVAAMRDRVGAMNSIVISGDIAFGGDRDEYKFAEVWLKELCAAAGAKIEDIFVCPGNHDIDREKAKQNVTASLHEKIKRTDEVMLEPTLRGLLMDADVVRLLYEPLQNYNTFALQFFCDVLAPNRTIAKRDLTLNDGSILRLHAFNSALVSSAADRPNDLFVDPACYQIGREEGVANLVLCHHPPHWLRRGEALADQLNSEVAIQLFGHEHKQRYIGDLDYFRVAAAAMHPDRTEPGWEPGYNILSVNVDGSGSHRSLLIEAHIRLWQDSPPYQFRPKLDRGGVDVFKRAVRLDPWQPPPPPPPPAGNGTAAAPTTASAQSVAPGADVMSDLRSISVRFFALTFSQKQAIAGRLNLFEEEDRDQPDFERFRRVFLRARERNIVGELDREIAAHEN